MHGISTDRIIRYFTADIWQASNENLPKPRLLAIRFMRIVVITIKNFIRDNCALRASALTFYTLLSIVPVVAMAFGIAKGFGLEQGLESQLHLRFAGQEEVISKVIDFAHSLLENTKGGLIAGIGVALLFWSAIKVLNHIENTLNHIWKVRARSAIRKFTDYLTIMIISPLLVVVSSSLNVYITTQITAITGKLALLRAASPLIFLLLKLVPFGLIWLLFFLIYMVMPNTTVRLLSAVLAGVIGGSIYQILQGFYISAQVLVSKYNAIYGSFAALPLFLIWLQLSWMIVLLGAEIAYAHQHVGLFSMTADYDKTSVDFRRRYALHILYVVIKRFQTGERAFSADQIAATLKLPFMTTARLIDQLRESGLLSAIEGPKNDGPALYQPARDINTITIGSVIGALDKAGRAVLPDKQDSEFQRVFAAVDAIQAAIDNSPANCLVKDI